MLIITQPNRAEIYHVYIIVKQSQQYYAKLNNVRCTVDAIMMALWIEIGVAYLHCVVILA
jgi:hypothetical protein